MNANSDSVRKHLSADSLFALIRARFRHVPDPRTGPVEIPLADALMAGFAIFSLKDPSLLAFERRLGQAGMLGNLQRLYGIGKVPCDTQMRTVLDNVSPKHLRRAFRDVFGQLQRGKVLERYVFRDGCYLLSLDGTEYFRSDNIHCPNCLQQISKNGRTTYYHQMLAGTIVHPDLREVIPLAPEPICRSDGDNKNDCERNAARRFLEDLSREHPHLKVIVVQDGLSSNGPHVRDLQRLGHHYILACKPGDHASLFAEAESRLQSGQAIRIEKDDPASRTHKEYVIVENISLNDSHPDLKGTFVEFRECGGKTRRHFSWFTDLKVTSENVEEFVRGGRARWKIENETFNTLKNQGYHFEHNYGHGERNLSTVFAFLMMLAFLTDQAQQACCALFQAAREKMGTKRDLWESLRSLMRFFELHSMAQAYAVLIHGVVGRVPEPADSS